VNDVVQEPNTEHDTSRELGVFVMNEIASGDLPKSGVLRGDVRRALDRTLEYWESSGGSISSDPWARLEDALREIAETYEVPFAGVLGVALGVAAFDTIARL